MYIRVTGLCYHKILLAFFFPHEVLFSTKLGRGASWQIRTGRRFYLSTVCLVYTLLSYKHSFQRFNANSRRPHWFDSFLFHSTAIKVIIQTAHLTTSYTHILILTTSVSSCDSILSHSSHINLFTERSEKKKKHFHSTPSRIIENFCTEWVNANLNLIFELCANESMRAELVIKFNSL